MTLLKGQPSLFHYCLDLANSGARQYSEISLFHVSGAVSAM